MKSGKSWWSILGVILFESIWVIDLGVDLYTGEVSFTDLILTLTFCFLGAGFLCYIFRRKRRKERETQHRGRFVWHRKWVQVQSIIGRQTMYIIPVGNKYRIICLLVVISLLLTACYGGVSDWIYEFPNNYAIVRVNSQTVVFGKKADTFEQILSRYIIAYSFNDIYIYWIETNTNG